jgi:hypothetical protein
LYSTDVQNVQGENRDSSITQDLSDVQNVQWDASSRVQNVHLINTNINTYNTAPTINSSFPINPVNDNPEHLLEGGRAAAAPAEIDYRGLEESAKLWLEYKAEKKSKYRGAKSIQIMINQLWKKSNGNPERAMAIVENSIANNYQGLFEARENNQAASVQPVKANSNIKFNHTK